MGCDQSYLKGTVLASLEAQGLIRKTSREVPIATQEEQDEVIRLASKKTRRAERNAIKKGFPIPAPQEPATTISVYGWWIGPKPGQTTDESKDTVEDSSSTVQGAQAEPVLGWEEARWTRAVRMEEQYYWSRHREDLHTAERQRFRRELYRQERQRMKDQREEDERLGRTEDIKAEKKRMEALATIDKYARLTGEDVSGWYEELGNGPIGDIGSRVGRIHGVPGGMKAKTKNTLYHRH